MHIISLKNLTDHNYPWFLSDFSELKKNKQTYTQATHPSAREICIANNYASNTQNLQILKDMTQYIQTYIKFVHRLTVVINTSFDVKQLKYVNTLLQNEQLKVRKYSLIFLL